MKPLRYGAKPRYFYDVRRDLIWEMVAERSIAYQSLGLATTEDETSLTTKYFGFLELCWLVDQKLLIELE